MRASMNWESPGAGTVHTSAVTNLVSCELEKVPNYSVMSPKTTEISQPVHRLIATSYKNTESYCEIAKKVGLTFSAVRYTIKHFLLQSHSETTVVVADQKS